MRLSMPVNDIDIWRSANLYVQRYGDDAAIHAAMQADRFLDAGDLDGAAVWRRILSAIEELQRTEPDGDAQSH